MTSINNKESVLLCEKPDIITPIQPMFFDTDVGGGVHNIAYLRFIETARTLLAFEKGLNSEAMRTTSIFPVVVDTEIHYKKPAFFGDQLEVHGWLGEASTARFSCHFKIYRTVDQTLITTCHQVLAFVKMPEGKPLRLPKGFPSPFSPSLPAKN